MEFKIFFHPQIIKKMRQGFELLKIRDINNKIDVKSFEDENDLTLPPVYRAFIESFEINSSGFNSEKFLHPQWGDVVDITTIQYLPHPEEIVVYEMFPVEKVLEVLKSLYQDNSEVTKHKLLPIGECAFNGMLMLGCGSTNQDQIFFEQPHGEQKIVQISNNIFEFMRGLVQTPDSNGNIGKYSFSKLYKKWDEDFWRVQDSVKVENR